MLWQATLAAAFRKWAEATEEAHLERQKLGHAVAIISSGKLGMCFATWRAAAEDRAAVRERTLQAVQLMQNRCLGCAWRSWRSIAADRAHQRHIIGQVSSCLHMQLQELQLRVMLCMHKHQAVSCHAYIDHESALWLCQS